MASHLREKHFVCNALRCRLKTDMESKVEKDLVAKLMKWNKLKNLAEREGFEPPIPVKVCLLSRQVPSTTRPSLRPPMGCHDNFIRYKRQTLTTLSNSQPTLDC